MYSASNFISKKYGYGEKDQNTHLSQAYHLRAIDVITQTISSEIPYLNSIVEIYQKNYIVNRPLEKIPAIPDESLYEASFTSPNQAEKVVVTNDYATAEDEYLRCKSKKKHRKCSSTKNILHFIIS